MTAATTAFTAIDLPAGARLFLTTEGRTGNDVTWTELYKLADRIEGNKWLTLTRHRNGGAKNVELHARQPRI
mgnify:CR=1 FL=1